MLGKEKCRILKEIRRRIADENDIPYVTRECGFQGECRGTCPRCESELRYLEKQLALRASLGKRVAVAALCASVGLGASACSPSLGRYLPGGGDDVVGMMTYEPAPTPEPQIEVEMGEIAWDGETEEPENEPEAGEIVWDGETEEPENTPFELTGDVAWVPEEGDG
ncbi:MAG: hypothetical protein IJQ43_07135 [Oscillospiraceae bacterium]|nr:hypothetical protein [Oscillospiraceae bacterium]